MYVSHNAVVATSGEFGLISEGKQAPCALSHVVIGVRSYSARLSVISPSVQPSVNRLLRIAPRSRAARISPEIVSVH